MQNKYAHLAVLDTICELFDDGYCNLDNFLGDLKGLSVVWMAQSMNLPQQRYSKAIHLAENLLISLKCINEHPTSVKSLVDAKNKIVMALEFDNLFSFDADSKFDRDEQLVVQVDKASDWICATQ